MKLHALVFFCALLLSLAFCPSDSLLLGDDLVISEFMAVNSSTFYDEDGESSDWIELSNRGMGSLNIGGWYLTDDASDLEQWSIPSTVLESGERIVIFASGKDRNTPGAELHTNFRLSGAGEYLALVRPDGTVAQAFDEYPRQIPDLSFGFGENLTVAWVTDPQAPVRAIIPLDGALGTGWTGGDEPFDDAAWLQGAQGVGYIVSQPGLSVDFMLAATAVGNLDAAEEVARNPGLVSREAFENAAFIDYYNTGGTGRFSNDLPFPSTTVGSDVNDFVVEVTGFVYIPQAGPWTFGVNSDDGFGLDLSGNGASFRIEYPDPRGTNDTLGVFDVPSAGTYTLRLLFYERGGGSALELFAQQGTHGSYNSGFRLIGDTANGGLAASSNPQAGGATAGIVDSIGIDVKAAMLGTASSAYVRQTFQAGDPGSLESLTLRIKYDDGFVAYLNGHEVARRNAPAIPAYNSLATADQPASRAAAYVNIDLTQHMGHLQAGTNILALHGLNDSVDSDEFLLAAGLAQITLEPMAMGFYDEPTPGEVNSDVFLDFVEDTSFQPNRGFFDEPIAVEITTDTPDATIRYTVDGSEPTLSNGFDYTAPIPVTTTTTLRAAAFKPDCIPTNVDTHTYIFIDDVLQQPDLPQGFPSDWAGDPVDYGMDPDVVNGPLYSDTIREDMLSIPVCSIVMNVDDLFGPNRGIYSHSNGSGISWERRASAELFFPEGVSIPGGGDGFQVNCAIRMYGGVGRNAQFLKHTFRFLFKGDYGPTKLNYPLFAGAPSQLKGQGPTERFDTLILRAGFNNSWHRNSSGEANRAQYLRDQFIRDSLNDMGQPNCHGLFVHLYLNGLYWGVYNVVERPSAPFCASYFGGLKDDWDALNSSAPIDGSKDAWNTLMAICDTDLSTPAAYEEIQEYLDVPNLIDYMLTNFYGGNADWDGHNWYSGRLNAPGAGYKFFSWDAERTLEGTTGSARISLNNNDKPSRPYAALRVNQEYLVQFGDRAHQHMFHGGALSPEACAERYRNRTDEIDRAIVGESARWGDSQRHDEPYTRDDEWIGERDRLFNDYFPRRTSHLLGQLRNAGLYPELDAPSFNQHGGEIEEGFIFTVSAPFGATYCTFDGSDPRLPGGGISPAAQEIAGASGMVLLEPGSEVRVLVPEDGALGSDWIGPDFDDASWRLGETGVGYERNPDAGVNYTDLIATDVESAMYGNNASVYIRCPFVVEDAARLFSLTLQMKYEDGFVAYLNGTRVAGRGDPMDPQWNSTATGSNADGNAIVYETIPLEGGMDLLVDGVNVLAIHGLNVSTSSSDFLILPRLDAAVVVSGQEIIFNETTHVKARAYSDGQWSALNEAVFRTPSPLEDLQITEIMFNPQGSEFIDGDEYEFIEIKNLGNDALDLTGVTLSEGISFAFAAGTRVMPGDFVVVASNATAFEDRYGPMDCFAGSYAGKLSNTGDTVAINDPDGYTLTSVTYNDLPPWPEEVDGLGYSLVPVDPLSPVDPNLARFWRPSTHLGGSPGEDDPGDGPTAGWQRPGDLNQDGMIDLSDAVSFLLYLFDGGTVALPCEGGVDEASANMTLFDLNGDDRIDLADSIYLLTYLFLEGEPPVSGTACIPVEGCPSACRP